MLFASQDAKDEMSNQVGHNPLFLVPVAFLRVGTYLPLKSLPKVIWHRPTAFGLKFSANQLQSVNLLSLQILLRLIMYWDAHILSRKRQLVRIIRVNDALRTLLGLNTLNVSVGIF